VPSRAVPGRADPGRAVPSRAGPGWAEPYGTVENPGCGWVGKLISAASRRDTAKISVPVRKMVKMMLVYLLERVQFIALQRGLLIDNEYANLMRMRFEMRNDFANMVLYFLFYDPM
jgi:hypothetical protein